MDLSMIDPISALLLVLCALIAFSDIYARRVPNRWLGYTVVLGGIWMLATWLAGHGPFPLPALLGLLAGLTALLPFYLVGWMGAGDVKFFAVLGFLLGWRTLLPLWIIASLLAGMYISASLFSQRVCLQASFFAQARLPGQAWWHKLINARQGRQGTPYAACLSAATILIVLSGHSSHA